MRGERWLLRAGEFLVARAARHLPPATRQERRQEWVAELPVILSDPEITPAPARAARMLWFAADTLRGAALRPGPSRRRGPHRGTAGKTTRQLGVLAAALTGMAVLLAILAFMVYQTIFGVTLAYYVAFWLISLASLTSCLLRRPPGRVIRYWVSAGLVTAATAQLVSALARHFGGGHPLLFTVIVDCGQAVAAACACVVGAIAIRSARRQRQPGLQEE